MSTPPPTNNQTSNQNVVSTIVTTPTTVTATANTSTPKPASVNFWNIAIIFIGIFVMMMHILLYVFNKDVFNIIISLYVISFSIMFIVFINKKKKVTSNTEYVFLIYVSMFVICIELIVFILSLVSLFKGMKKIPSYKYNSY